MYIFYCNIYIKKIGGRDHLLLYIWILDRNIPSCIEERHRETLTSFNHTLMWCTGGAGRHGGALREETSGCAY